MDLGNIQSVDIDEQMRSAYIDYAMSVIVARALPDARDGLKPVHRRILYAMHDMGIRANTPYKKSARIVGEVLGKYHPHGDAAVYESMARLAQDFSLRYTLVDGQGNFGSIDGDAPAAMRYTEARLSHRAEEMLLDIDKDTVAFGDNFDGSLREPHVLPTRLPNLLLNGSYGIAVGMATNIPPHNISELAAGLIYLIDNFDHIEDISVEELIKLIPGPDFPTGGVIVGNEGILSAYSTGRGRLILRGQAHIEEMNNNRFRIVITQIPYQLNKSSLIERIAELSREGKLDEVSDLRDESDRNGMSIVIELRRSAQPRKVLNQLYKYTPLQSTFGVQMLALVDGEPRLLTLKRMLQIFVEHRIDVITRRSAYELTKARDRAHILDGLLIAIAHMDEIIQLIRSAPDVETARERLMTRFSLSERQANAILDMQLRRLAALERQKIEDEHSTVLARIAYLEELLASPNRILTVIKEELTEVAGKYADERRTQIAYEATENLREEDLVQDAAVLVSITSRGYIKRVAAKAFRAQSRGGRGVTGHATREEDEVLMFFPARTLDTILFFSDRGKVYSEKAYQIPDAERTGRGIPIVNILSLDPGESITATVSVHQSKFDRDHYCTLVTHRGRIKRLPLAEFASVRPSGILAINLDPGDELGWARMTSGKDELIFVTQAGKALRYAETAVRATGRTAAGVTAIRLDDDDLLTSMEVIEPSAYLLVVSSGGIGKRIPLDQFTPRGRATSGIQVTPKDAAAKVGLLAAARVVQTDDELTFISANGVVLRTRVADIPVQSRIARGVRLMNLQAGDRLVSLARISPSELLQTGE